MVARGDVPFALGTDTAGSGRVPAGFNGLVGLKPTPGRVSTHGVVPACRSLDCVSVFATGIDDAAEVLAVIEGADAADPYSRFEPGAAALPAPLRLGIPREPFFFGDAGYAEAWPQALAHAEALGATPVPIDFGTLDEVAALLYDGPWVAERHAAVRELFEAQPAAALDVSVQAVVLQLIEALKRELGLAMIFVSHDLNVVRLLTDRVAVMYLGKIVEVGPSEQVFRAPRHPYTQSLISAIPGQGPRIRLAGEVASPIDPPKHACRFHGRCPRDEDRCGREAPLPQRIGERLVACHFALPAQTAGHG
jgi:oligopeptide/dipeptide ABC transporter ATP-binding protein